MNIFISNDDGINSKALHILAKEMSKIGNVYIVAPRSERSAFSHHFTIHAKMQIEEKQVDGATKAYSLDGTPCDCVHAGLQTLVKEKIDLVVSGINKGWNANCDVIYSGTVAAAREGFMQGIPAMAVSLDSFVDDNYEYAAKVAREIALEYIKDPKNKEYFLNVNVPNIKEEEVKGILVCDGIGKIDYNEGYHIETEFGVDYLVSGTSDDKLNFDREDLTIDINAMRHGYVSITPLDNDQINHNVFDEVKNKWERK